MPVLKNITLSNIRRFAKDVSIPLSPQATIFLAPNGTGKTALFEAIELAISGNVARMGDDLFAIVKDHEEQAGVTLDFGDFFQEASVTAKGDVFWTPPTELFGNAEQSDISYLLRLTHLLDQTDKHWFVQEQSQEAGSLLSRLPIAQEAQKLGSNLPKLRNAASKIIAAKQQEADIAQSNLEAWHDLQRDKKEVQKLSGQVELSIELIGSLLLPYMEDDTVPNNVESLSIKHSVCVSNNRTLLEEKKRHYTSLSKLFETCDEYASLKLRKQNNIEVNNQLLILKSQSQSKRDNALSQVAEYEREISKTNEELNRALEEQKVLSGRENCAELIAKTHESLVAEVGFLKVKQESVDKARESYAKLEADFLENNQWEARKADWMRLCEEFNNAESLLLKWKENLQRINEIEEELQTLESSFSSADVAIEKSTQALKATIDEANEVKLRLTTLQRSNDQVRSAVAAIAANISGKEGDCPVCGEPHGVRELESRMEKQLQLVTPELRVLSETNAILKRQLSQQQSAHDILIAEKTELTHKLKASNELLEQCSRTVSACRLHHLFEDLEIEDATVAVSNIDKQIKDKKSQLDEEAKTLPSRPSEESIALSNQFLEKEKTNFSEKQSIVFQLESTLRELESEFQKLKSIQTATLELNEIKDIIVRLKNTKEHANQERTKSQSIFDLEQEQLSKLDTKINDLLVEIKNNESEQKYLKNMWVQNGLSDEPNKETVKNKVCELEEAINKIEKEHDKLEVVRTKIAQLYGSEKLRGIQREIDKLRADHSEELYEEYLSLAFAKASKDLKHLEEKKSTLDTFAKKLNEEIDQIQTKVASIEPLWQSLLSRVVREKRFSQTGLEVNRKYNKAHAHVNVPLSNRAVNASKVASEAQKTDLQLTFLLSMALANPWSPWRALLLDDPTQHHDLVHASAIFDVLRDYILEYGFQLLMTTHDPVQARFMSRKLENDGIQVRIVNLVPEVDGVKAKWNASPQLELSAP
ncbi:hypothetical protein K6U59_16835 [Vibrio vulnificus]|nr:hypothetical protein [Vibrio vulnificus]